MKTLKTPLKSLAFIGLLATSPLLVTQTQASVFINASYNAATVFQDQLGSTTMTLAHDGSTYWSSSGGGTGGIREAQYTSAGALINTYSPGLDFRSIFTDSSGNVFARQYASPTIYNQTTPGTFATYASLSGGTLDSQSSVVLNGAGTEYIAMIAGVVSRWDLAGTHLGNVALSGYGIGAESNYPQYRGIAAVGNYWLTYDGSTTTLSAWDVAGTRVGTTVLNGAGNSFDSNFSLSYANGQAFIVDYASGMWRGYDVGLSAVPEPSTYLAGALLLLPFGFQGVRYLRRRQV